MNSQPAAQIKLSAWFKLAELAIVMCTGSVEEERMFSAMKYLTNAHRSRLGEKHLTACARGFKCSYSLSTFPYAEAIEAWLKGAPKRGRYGQK